MSENQFQNRSVYRIFLSYFRPHLKLFLLDLLCATLISAVDLAYPYLSRIAMYNWLPENRYAVFFLVMGIVAVAYLLRSVLYYIVAYWGHTFGIRVEADIRRDLFAHIQSMDNRFFDRNRTGVLLSRMTTDLFDISELAHHAPEDIFISAITIVGSLIFMYGIEWRMALVLTVLLPVFVLVVMRTRKEMGIAALSVKQKTGRINAELESALSGIRTSRAFANESVEYRRFLASNEEFKTSKREFHKAMGRFNGVMEFFCCIMSVVIMTVGGWQIMKGRMNYIDLLTFCLYITSFVNPIRKLANTAELFSSGKAGLDRFAEIMREEPQIRDAENAPELHVTEGAVSLEHVSFSYNDESETLHDIQLEIAGGETLAVVGSSGGGKTTLCHLIPRFYDVDSGCIRIDGQDIRSVTQDSLHRAIGIVAQDLFLFPDTIRENIRFGRPDATDEEVEQAARLAEIYEDVIRMPHGFDTYVGERGVLLSGGQKQRISIARVFLKNPSILILDEATSALDSVTERSIQKAFDALAEGRTTILIAHRLSTIRNAHRIIVVEDGEIKESGTRQALLARNGIFAKLSASQDALP